MTTVTNYSVELIRDSQVFPRNLAVRRLTDPLASPTFFLPLLTTPWAAGSS
jgi:hypothetical protein